MNTHDWLITTAQQLSAAGISSSRLDALVLLEDCLQLDRAQLLAHPEIALSARQLTQLSAQLERRATHEPLAYIRGHSEFYGRKFFVDQRVLVPRPESETMITLLKKLAPPAIIDGGTATIIDVGTGSGALAITAALELPSATVLATDIDADCLRVARGNAQALGAVLKFVQGDLLTPVLVPLASAILLCNLPYVPAYFAINRAARHEPPLALFGGADGLELFRKLFAQIKSAPVKPRLILTESLPQQHVGLTQLAAQHGFAQQQADDFIQVFSATLSPSTQ